MPSGVKRQLSLGQEAQEAMDDGTSPSQLTVEQKINLFETPRRESSNFPEAGGPASSRRRLIGALHVFGQPSPVDSDRQPVPVSYVSTADIGIKDVRDHKSGGILPPELVKAGREKERENMKERSLYDLTHIRYAAGKKVRSMWLDEKRVGEDGVVSVRSRCVAMEFNEYERLDTYAGTPPLKFVKIVISRAATKRRPGVIDWTRVLGLYDIVTVFWHADLPLDEPTFVIPPKGEEYFGWGWQMRKSAGRCSTRLASTRWHPFTATTSSWKASPKLWITSIRASSSSATSRFSLASAPTPA